jgi:hypothetical protein
MIFFGKGSRQDHAGEDVIAGADTFSWFLFFLIYTLND